MRGTYYKVTTSLDDLKEGLFGQIVLWIFEILPYLEKHCIFPDWDIKSRLYGVEPDYTVIPGVFNLAYTPVSQFNRTMSLLRLRASHVHTIGGDWQYAHRLWHSYFTIPHRVRRVADEIPISKYTLGVHYRGNDKNQTPSDTNFVSQQDFLILIKDFLKDHQDVESIFIATDEFSFVQSVQQKFAHLKIINLGRVDFHKSSTNVYNKADRALLDCLLLSRCKYLLKCSSALSAFAKVLNPRIEAYRISASKLLNGSIPYFPDAYIPKLVSSSPECSKILERLFIDDWLDHQIVSRDLGIPFRAVSRYKPLKKLENQIMYTVAASSKKLFPFLVKNT
jgi:hypothetical protein